MGVFATNLCFLPPCTHFLDPLLKLYYYFTTVHPVLGTTFCFSQVGAICVMVVVKSCYGMQNVNQTLNLNE